ncbi:MAG: Cna B-type domain-containing protein [Clostridia bacterium]|nr:Cna B-type domain-containing protein [Clostridia bacterium]
MNAFKNRIRQLNIKSIVFYAACVILCIAACVLMFCANITHSVALEQQIRCGIQEHTHSDECYSGDFLTCSKPNHTHDGNCYIVLLKENDINNILTLLSNTQNYSLENVISDTMSSALTFNANINSVDSDENGTPELSQDKVAELNNTILNEDQLPDIVLNENINTLGTLAADNTNDQISTLPNTFNIQAEASNSNYKANFYIYLDGKWTCIGTLDFTTQRNGTRYNSVIPTADVLELVNNALGTSYAYNSFDISVATSLNGTYSKTNIGIASATTTIAYRQQTTAARTARYVRLIPEGGGATSTAFAFNTVEYVYPDGTTVTEYVRSGSSVKLPSGNYEWTSGGNTYYAEQSVAINQKTTFEARLLGPPTYINVSYDVAFPSVSGVTVSTRPTLAGLATTTVTDEFTENSFVTLRNVSQHSVQGTVDGNGTGLTRAIQFKGWRVGNTDTIIQPNTRLIWEELVQYSNNSTSLKLTAVWEYDAKQTAAFFIRFDSVAVDTEGNVTGQDTNKYTKQIFAAYVGGVDTSLSVSTLQSKYGIADTTSDNSFGADQEIRALYGERTDGVWLSAFPNDDAVFADLVQYANTGYLSVDGVPVKAEDLNSKEYAIRWYVFKAQDDAWHIDGKLVKKVGLIHVYKTFAGNKELIADAKNDFYIDATDVSTGVNTVLNLNNYTTYDPANEKYMWEINDVDYGEYWQITEHPHNFTDDSVQFSVYSEYTVMDAHGDQSVSGTGTSLTVSGMTYALDEGIDEVLRAEFTNIYNRSDSIIIKKQDSLTGVAIGGAVFSLYQNGQPLKFTYNSVTDRYEYNEESGTITALEGSANGYYEICIEDFSYDAGPITIRETVAPTGYTPIGDITVGHTDNERTVGIIGGNSELIKYYGGVLIVGNSTDSSSVTVRKEWECDQAEWQPVKLQLLANGKLVSTVMAGVVPETVLSADNGWTYTWDNLPVYVNGTKIEWSVKETAIGDETTKADGSFVNWLVSYGIPVITTDADGNENTLLTVTNTTKRVMLRLTKTNLFKTEQLAGATFVLEAVDKNGNLIVNEVAKTATTAAGGALVFDNLKCGVRYRLTETAAPDGYLQISEYIYLTINEDGTVSVEESFYAEAGTTAYNVVVKNGRVVDLPDSGGIGTSMFYVLGLTLITLAAGIYIYHLFKGRCYH